MTKNNEDVIAKVKAEAEAKAEAKRIAEEQAKDDPSLLDDKVKNEELAKAAAAASADIEKAERTDADAIKEDEIVAKKNANDSDRSERGEAAYKKLRLIAMSYPQTTPDEHVVFGFGGHRYTVGDLRDIADIRQR